MKNKGFTLIELLAVIVILAIIALIATPIILGIINDSRDSAAERGAELVISNVELAYSSAYMDNNGNYPKLEDVAKHFKMDNAKMSADGKTIEGGRQEVVVSDLSSDKAAAPDSKSAVAYSEQEKDIKENGTAPDSKVTEQVIWKDLENVLFKEKTPEKIAGLFEKIWKKEILEQWMIAPEKVLEKKQVKAHYEKLNSQIHQLEKIFEDAGMTKSPAAKAIQNTASNLDFMNQLNQMHAYIQLPLKMANQNAHGELYVFSNKRNLTKQDGKVTALLHLDMENLGKMDVYVALENKKVSTNFYLEKEEYLDFLEGHMELLTSRLNKRGYSCDIKTTLRNSEEEPVIKTIEKQQDHPLLLSMQAFDVRA